MSDRADAERREWLLGHYHESLLTCRRHSRRRFVAGLAAGAGLAGLCAWLLAARPWGM